MAEQTCTRCGAELRPGVTFCVRCGEPRPGTSTPPTEPQATPVAPVVVRDTEQVATVQRDQTRRVVLAGVLALILTLLARIAFAAASDSKPDGEVIATLPAGPEGASETFDDGGKIKVPKGALRERRTITVRRTVLPDRVRAISPYGGSIVIPAGAQTVYIFSPVDITFLRAVTIVLPLPPPPDQGIVFVSANGRITFIQGEAGKRTISIRVTSFNFADSRTFV